MTTVISQKPDWTKAPQWFSRFRRKDDYKKGNEGDYEQEWQDLPSTESEPFDDGYITIADGIPMSLSLGSDGTVTFAVPQLRRVIVAQHGIGYRIERELLSIAEADEFVDSYNVTLPEGAPRAESIDYVEAWRRARELEWQVDRLNGLE